MAGKWNCVEAGCCLAKPTSLRLRYHVGKKVKCLNEAEGQLYRGDCETTKNPLHPHFEQQYFSPEEG